MHARKAVVSFALPTKDTLKAESMAGVIQCRVDCAVTMVSSVLNRIIL